MRVLFKRRSDHSWHRGTVEGEVALDDGQAFIVRGDDGKRRTILIKNVQPLTEHEVDVETLLKVSKLIPRLGSDNAHEKMATLLMIEKLLAQDSITWTDVGMQVTEFLTSVLGATEEEALPAASPPPAAAWTTTSTRSQPAPAPAQAPGTGWQAQPQPRPTYNPPPQRPRGPDPRCHGSTTQRRQLVAEIIAKRCWNSPAEQQVIQALIVQLNMNLTISRKQIRVLETVSTRL